MTSVRVSPTRIRRRARFAGLVQGVGFRPWVARLARACDIAGAVWNGAEGVCVEAEGSSAAVEDFLRRIGTEAPGSVAGIFEEDVPTRGERQFTIAASTDGQSGASRALPPADCAPCGDCLAELADPGDRRYRYPFIACAACGPRYSVIESLPFDRERTTMRDFPLVGDCAREYADPANRRYHAEMIAGPECGPRLWWRGERGRAEGEAAIAAAVTLLRDGGILALKGVGGFQLLCDARNPAAVERLRARKARDAKPFALMAADIQTVRRYCRVSSPEATALDSPAAPIVLLERQAGAAALAEAVAPGVSTLGFMLPASALHALLAGDFGAALVATSGNRSGEPLCRDNDEAMTTLQPMADGFLLHDRRIVRSLDDSVIRVIDGQPTTLRLGRGFAPCVFALPQAAGGALARGAHLKNALAMLNGNRIVQDAHIGDLQSPAACAAHELAGAHLTALTGVRGAPEVCDAHPDYFSSRCAASDGARPLRIWHHHAHILACQLDNAHFGPVLGVSWDGTGLGPDGTLWGGEFLYVDGARFRRLGHLRPFALPGGTAAIGEPLRVAAVLLFETFGEVLPAAGAFVDEAVRAAAGRWLRLDPALAPRSCGAGRLFDGFAALLGLADRNRYEGQAAMCLEAAAVVRESDGGYDCRLIEGGGGLLIDWRPVVAAVVEDLQKGTAVAAIASRVHDALARAIVGAAARLDIATVALSGGCFQNRRLAETAASGLRAGGHRVLRHCRLPPGDGGIAAGQALAAWYASGG